MALCLIAILNWQNKFKYIAGIITDKDILPITRLNFGRTLLTSSHGFHTLGQKGQGDYRAHMRYD